MLLKSTRHETGSLGSRPTVPPLLPSTGGRQQAVHFVAVFAEVFEARVKLKLGLTHVGNPCVYTATSMFAKGFRSFSMCHCCQYFLEHPGERKVD